jgi:hypothetical protein
MIITVQNGLQVIRSEIMNKFSNNEEYETETVPRQPHVDQLA